MKKQIIKIFLVIMIAVFLLPMAVSVASASIIPNADGYYWMDSTAITNPTYTYIKEIAMGAYDPNMFDNMQGTGEDQAISALTGMLSYPNYGYLKYDLNAGAGGDYIYIGWNTTKDPAEAITGVQARVFDDIDESEGPVRSYTHGGVTWYLANSGCHEWAPKLNKDKSEDGYLDLNDGAGGDYIFLYVTKDPAYGPPISSIESVSAPNDSNPNYSGICDVNGQWTDFNSGTEDDAIYLRVKSEFQGVNIQRMRDLYEWCNTFLNTSKPNFKYVLGNLSATRDELRDLLAKWDANNIYAGSTKFSVAPSMYPTIVDLKNSSAESSINSIKGVVYFNAEANWGNENYNKSYSLGTNPTVDTLIQVDLGAESASKSGYEFLGWNTNKNAREGQKSGTVTVAPGTSFYAIFKKTDTAKFHYYDADGNVIQTDVSTVVYNKESETYTVPSAPKTVIKDGKEYTLVGWHGNQDATAPKHTASSETVTEGIHSSLYAVYTTPVKLSFNTGIGGALDDIYSERYQNVSGNMSKARFTLTSEPTPPDGYAFLGWACADNSTEVEYPTGSAISSNADITVYALWHEHELVDDGNCTTNVVCSCGDIVVEGKTAHTGGTASCTQRAICSECNSEYGETNADNHSKTTFLYTANADGKTHTKKHECCDAISEADEAHIYGEGDKCVCGAKKPVVDIDVNTNTDTDINTDTDTVAFESKTLDTVNANVSEKPQSNKGCGSAIGASGAMLAVMLVGFALLFVKRKKYNTH